MNTHRHTVDTSKAEVRQDGAGETEQVETCRCGAKRVAGRRRWSGPAQPGHGRIKRITTVVFSALVLGLLLNVLIQEGLMPFISLAGCVFVCIGVALCVRGFLSLRRTGGAR